MSEILFPRQGSYVKSTWYGYCKDMREKGLASLGLLGFKLLKQTKLSPDLLKHRAASRTGGVAVVLAAPER